VRIAIVIPWFGRDLKGGAEQHAWQVASRLAARGHSVEVLSTCCRSHQDDWATNHLAEGLTSEPEGFRVRRFAVVNRDREAFDKVCSHLLALNLATLKPGVPPVAKEESQIFCRELIKAPELTKYLAAHTGRYDSFILLPYLYGPVLEAILLLGSKATLIPCLHDEAYAYLSEVSEAFYQAGSLFFISEGEQELAFRLFGPGIIPKSTLVGAGVEAPTAAAPSPHDQTRKHGKYFLYLGRKDAGKNVPLLLRAFSRFRAVRPNSDLQLALAGYGTVELSGAGNGIVDHGLVGESEKARLLRDCDAVVQPSRNESFARVIMEAWLQGKPALVHARCPATALTVKKAQAGWVADTEDEWAALFVALDRTPEPELRRLGENGRRYATVEANWDNVITRYEATLQQAIAPHDSIMFGGSSKQRQAINQFLPNLSYGDAISNEAIWIRDQIRRAGHRSEIFVQYIDPILADECHVFSAAALTESDAIIYHHSIGTEITPCIIEFSGPKCLVYHNITPGEFFEPYRPDFAKILHRGRADLTGLATCFEHSVGDSAFNAAELAHCGFRNPGVLPLPVDPAKWACPADPDVMDKLGDGRTNILFVGRFAPNKKQDDLITAFWHYLEYEPDARLILVGKPEHEDPYVAHLDEMVARWGLRDSVLLPGSVGDAQLAAYYRTGHLFWSMSEHEGFCVPLIESMWFDIPALAFRSSAVPETLGEAALMFDSKADLTEPAGLAYLIAHDLGLREKIIRAQRKCRLRFLPHEVMPHLNHIINKLSVSVAVG